MNKFTTAILAAAVFIASVSAAMAAPGVVTGNANVRSGAGTGYPVISSVQYGQPVEIEYCQGSWCHVSKPGRDGWVSVSYLTTDNSWGDDNYGNYGRHGHRNHGGWNNNGNWGHRNHGGWNNTVGINTCVSGQNASFCLGF